MKLSSPANSFETWNRLRFHISGMWPLLTRDLSHAVEAAQDSKTDSGKLPVPIYVSGAESAGAIAEALEKTLKPRDFQQIEVLPLPGVPERITRHGLLYLPGRYVVPGGRFNELYGWDSYFIVLGLLRDGRVGLAKSVTDQCLYEVQHYGSVLNCNRTYCLNRSQPPYLTRLVLSVFRETQDINWLRSALPFLEQYHAYWETPPHYVAAAGLSRYHALGEGPAPEVVHDERDETGLHHYERVCNALRDHPDPGTWRDQVYDPVRHALTNEGYKNDRTVRESGFDLTNRFGFCGLNCRDYLPVCLNTLLWCMESDLAEIRCLLQSAPAAIRHWETAAANRQARMNDYFWSEAEGLFQDWRLDRGERSSYVFATAFMPLWAGWASEAQAAALVRRLPDFMASGGLLTSLQTTGCQWDAPFTWAPLVLMAVQGLDRYGFHSAADEVSGRFAVLVIQEFERTGQLFEKYDAVERTSEVSGKLHFGYPTNEPGFGWTNAVLGELIARRPFSQASAFC